MCYCPNALRLHCIWQHSFQWLWANCVLSINVGKSLCVKFSFSLKPSRCFSQNEIWRESWSLCLSWLHKCVHLLQCVCVCVELSLSFPVCKFKPNRWVSCEGDFIYIAISTCCFLPPFFFSTLLFLFLLLVLLLLLLSLCTSSHVKNHSIDSDPAVVFPLLSPPARPATVLLCFTWSIILH